MLEKDLEQMHKAREISVFGRGSQLGFQIKYYYGIQDVEILLGDE